jgi:hypothetical protein
MATQASHATPRFSSPDIMQLFHPGVWLKNFAPDPRPTTRPAVNLVIDSDTMKTHAVRVLTGPVSPAGGDGAAGRLWPGDPVGRRRISAAELLPFSARR